MSLWDWVHDFVEEARRAGDPARARLLDYFWASREYKETDTDRALDILLTGRREAQRLGEARWVLFYDHWRLQMLLWQKKDFAEALDLAVASALEARKPAFADLPQRICLQEDLINAYIGIDPVGHADLIGQALEFMGQEITPDLQCRFCLLGARAGFEMACGRHDEAQASGLRLFALADGEGNRHYIVNACSRLCHVAFRAGDFTSLASWAEAGEEAARQEDRQEDLCEFLMWQALLARREREEARARRLWARVRTRLGRLSVPPGEPYYDALCAYHEAGDDLESALNGREAELEHLAGKGRLDQECRARVERCRLLAGLGRLTAGDVEEARAAAGKLRQPQRYLAVLDSLGQG
jgi:hypothetical protein